MLTSRTEFQVLYPIIRTVSSYVWSVLLSRRQHRAEQGVEKQVAGYGKQDYQARSYVPVNRMV